MRRVRIPSSNTKSPTIFRGHRSFSSSSATNNFENRLFVNGEFVKSSSNSFFDSINPGNGRVITCVSEASRDDVNAAVTAAKNAFECEQEILATQSGHNHDRIAGTLLHLAQCLETDFDNISKLETIDCGKPLDESKFDVTCSIKCLRYYASLVQNKKNWCNDGKAEQNLLDDNPDREVRNRFVATKRRQPLGVAALITPFNYPLLMSVSKIAPALASGCAIVHKPAEQTPLSALRLAQYYQEWSRNCDKNNIALAQGFFHVLPGRGSTTGQALIEHPLVDKVAFTGSTRTGQHILSTCAGSSNLKRVTLELGGKSPLVVHKDADLGAAVDAVILNIFGNSGQICTASSRVLCHREIHDRFVGKLLAETEKRLELGDCSSSTSCTMGPVISRQQQEKILGYIQSGIDEGATKMNFSTTPSKFDKQIQQATGFFVPPTIFTNVRDDMTIARDEIFGPVLSILTPFDDGDVEISGEGLVAKATNKDKSKKNLFDRCNDTEYGLGAGIFTKDERLQRMFCQRVNAGTIWVNGAFGFVFDQAPFGGFKKSGLGRELGGEEGMNAYMEMKSVIRER